MSAVHRVSALGRESDLDRELLLDRTDWAVIRPRPDARHHGQQLWSDLNIALGHDIDIVPRRRSESGAQGVALAHLATTDITDIAIASSNWLTPRTLTDYITAISAFGIRLWLIYDIETCDERHDAQNNLGMVTVDADEFLHARQRAPINTSGDAGAAFPEVLDVHFLGFLNIARELNTPDDLELITATFQQGRSEMQTILRDLEDPSEQDVALALHRITGHTTNLHEIVTLVKGAQTGALIEHWHLRVDINSWLMRGTSDGTSPRLTPSEWRTLGRLARPAFGAVAALCIAELSATEMLDITDDQFSLDLSSVTVNERCYPIPEAARQLIARHRIHRQLSHTDSDRFLINCATGEDFGPRTVSTQISQITEAAGITLRLHRGDTATITTHGWNYRYGVSIERISA
jgi:hypothetical protein